MKLKLTYMNHSKGMLCISRPHYDLHTVEDNGECFNIACILTDKEGAKLIRKWIKKDEVKK